MITYSTGGGQSTGSSNDAHRSAKHGPFLALRWASARLKADPQVLAAKDAWLGEQAA